MTSQFNHEGKGEGTVAQTEHEVLSQGDIILFHLSHFLTIYYSLFLLTIGTVGNILSVYILSQPEFQRGNASLFLRFLAGADVCVLYSGLVHIIIHDISGYDIRSFSRGFCTFCLYLNSSLADVSAWTLVAVTSERMLAIWRPFQVKAMCSKRNAYIVMGAVSVILLLANLPLIVAPGLWRIYSNDDSSIAINCVEVEQAHRSTLKPVWHWFDAMKFVFFPATILISLNTTIILLLRRAPLKNADATRRYDGAESMAAISGDVTTYTSRFTGSTGSSKTYRSRMPCIRKNRGGSLTMTLLGVNVTFIICNTPMMALFLTEQMLLPSGKGAKRFVITASLLAMYTNNAVNFLLYVLTGPRFRIVLYKLLRGWAVTEAFSYAPNTQRRFRTTFSYSRSPRYGDGVSTVE